MNIYPLLQKKKGFTLIELLVVIAIIALLASIVLVALNGARSKARDSTRRADLKQISTALELYYNDNGSYPNTGNSWWGTCSTFGAHGTSGANGWIPNLAPTYIGALPLDPLGASYCMLYNSNGTDYMAMDYGNVENCSNISSDPMRRPNYPNECDYTVYSGGGSAY
jgi:type II secretion system protein G